MTDSGGDTAGTGAVAGASTPAAVQASVTAYWNQRSGEYDTHPLSQIHAGEAKAAWTAILRDALPPVPADVLDVGTGTGFVSLLLAALGHRVVGIDLAEEMLATARAKASTLPAPPRLQLGDAVDPPFAPHSFDVVTNRYLLWTLRDPERALANLRRLLRSGGHLVAIDGVWFPQGWQPDAYQRAQPYWQTLIGHYSAGVRRGLPLAEVRSFDGFVAVVEAAGFADVRVTRLHEIERIERAMAGGVGADIQPQFLISARNAAGST